MADIQSYPFFRHLRGAPTSHIRHARNGRVVHEGVARSFWFRPLSAVLSEVPMDDRELPLMFHARTERLPGRRRPGDRHIPDGRAGARRPAHRLRHGFAYRSLARDAAGATGLAAHRARAATCAGPAGGHPPVRGTRRGSLSVARADRGGPGGRRAPGRDRVLGRRRFASARCGPSRISRRRCRPRHGSWFNRTPTGRLRTSRSRGRERAGDRRERASQPDRALEARGATDRPARPERAAPRRGRRRCSPRRSCRSGRRDSTRRRRQGRYRASLIWTPTGNCSRRSCSGWH